MRKESTESRSESRPEWEQLEDWVRSQVQRLIQELLEEEVTAFLGRAKSALRSDSDSDTGYRNGYGRARRLTLSSGTIQLRRPRVRDTEEQFESRLLPLFVNRTRKVAELIPELYLHGLSEGDFDLALRGLLGEDAPVSASTVARLKSKWNDELAQWRSRPLDDLEVVYMWVDGVYVKAGLGQGGCPPPQLCRPAGLSPPVGHRRRNRRRAVGPAARGLAPTPLGAAPISCVRRWGGCAMLGPGGNSLCEPTAASMPTPWSRSAARWMFASPSPSASAPACGI